MRFAFGTAEHPEAMSSRMNGIGPGIRSITTSRREPRQYTAGEEIAASVTHGIGAALAIAGLVVALGTAALNGSTLHVLSTAVYGTSVVLLYLASTLYHAIQRPRAKRVLKVLDHAAIYLLIAGTYTPFTLITLRGPWGWSIFGVIWTLAIAGISLEAFWVARPKWTSVVIFVAMGWMGIIAIGPLIAGLAGPGLWLLIAGGVSYTVGTLFYVWTRARYTHAIWHLWVIAGSVCHYFAILYFVVP
jgi:hemolysin III